MVLTVKKFPFWGLKNTENVMVSSASPMYPTKVMHLDPAKGLTASRVPELHWQLALTRRESPPKIIF